jgi:hypothetical protein
MIGYSWKGSWQAGCGAGGRKGGECLVLGVLIIRNVGTESSAMKIECSPDIRTEQLHRVLKIEI